MACSISLRGSLALPTRFCLTMTTSVAQQKVRSITRSSSHRGTVCLGHISASNVALIVSIIAPNYPHSFHGLGHKIGHPHLPNLIQRYLFEKAHPDDNPETNNSPTRPPQIYVSHADHIKVFHLAHAIFCALSNLSATTSMYHETIRATPFWNQGKIPRP